MEARSNNERTSFSATLRTATTPLPVERKNASDSRWANGVAASAAKSSSTRYSSKVYYVGESFSSGAACPNIRYR